jgi:hypothetical protein
MNLTCKTTSPVGSTNGSTYLSYRGLVHETDNQIPIISPHFPHAKIWQFGGDSDSLSNCRILTRFSWKKAAKIFFIFLVPCTYYNHPNWCDHKVFLKNINIVVFFFKKKLKFSYLSFDTRFFNVFSKTKILQRNLFIMKFNQFLLFFEFLFYFILLCVRRWINKRE